MAVMNFEQFAIKADLSDDKYPYSNLSFNSRKCIKYGLIFSAISGIITYAIRSLLYYIAQNTQNSETATNATATTADATSGGFQNMLPNFELPRIDFVGGLLAFHDWLSSTFNYLIWFTVISIAVYLFSLIRRNQSFERNVIANDRIARITKMLLVDSLSIDDKLLEIRRSNSGDGKGSKPMSLKDKVEKESLIALKKMKVFVNTRENLEGGEIRQQYRIVIELPTRIDSRESVIKMTEQLENAGTTVLNGEVKFGGGVISDDRKFLIFRAWLRVDNKFDHSQEVVKQYVERDDLDTVFPLSLFVDNQEKIKSIQSKAFQWGKRTASSLDAFVTTKKVQATRKSIIVGATSVLYTYELAQGTELPQIDKLGEVLDSVYRTKGSMVQLSAGDILISLPLPKEFVTPIDTATMFIEAFWQVEKE